MPFSGKANALYSMKLCLGGSLAALYAASSFPAFNKLHISSPMTYHKQQGWELVWSDEFDDSELDRSKWTPELSCWGGGNNELQCYTDRVDNIEVSNGVLKLIAQPEEFSGFKYSQDSPDRGELITQQYTSGKIHTKNLYDWKYGRFEARLKLSQGQSAWPAFWMLPKDNSYGEWPLSGEVDIVEAVNLGASCYACGPPYVENRSSVALHFGQPWPKNQFHSQKNVLPNGRDAYHTFALEWSEGRMDWFVENQKVFTMTKDEWFTDAVEKNVNPLAPFDKPFYLILNLAVGGDLANSGNEKKFNPSSFPAELSVDWVRVYQCAEDIDTSKSCAVSK